MGERWHSFAAGAMSAYHFHAEEWRIMDNAEPPRGNFEAHIACGCVFVLMCAALAIEGVHLLVDLAYHLATGNIPPM